MGEPFTMPHWTDPRVKAVAEAIWDDDASAVDARAIEAARSDTKEAA